MIFFGGIKSPLRRTLADIVLTADKDTKFQILCSGKFTIENILCNMGFKNVRGNDISLLTASIGKFLCGERVQFQFKPDSEFIELEKFIQDDKDDLSKIAVLLTIYHTCKDGDGSQLYKSLRHSVYMQNLEKYFYKNREEFQKRYSELVDKLAGFSTRDLVEFIEEPSDDVVRVCSIPIAKGDYENIYRVFDRNLEFEKYPYSEIDKDSYVALNEQCLEKHRSIVFTDRPLGGGYDSLLAAKYDIGGAKWFCYSSFVKEYPKHYYFENKNPQAFFKHEIFDGEEITKNDRVEVMAIKENAYNFFRNRYQSKKLIILGNAHLYFAVLINGKYVGGFAFKDYQRGVLVLLSDFTFFNKWRISKLIPMLARSKEVMENVVMRLYRRNLEGDWRILTRVVTEAPISMKYRGIWELSRRGVEDDGSKYLIYASEAGKNTIKEEFDLWLRKHYKIDK